MSADSTAMYWVDAFTEELFGGNPAAVVVLESAWEAERMQAVAREHGLSETAFLQRPKDAGADDPWQLRWFTPAVEVELCGHATLSSAFVIFEELMGSSVAPSDTIRFATASGELEVRRHPAGLEMRLPRRESPECTAPDHLIEALGAPVVGIFGGHMYLIELENEAAVVNLRPKFSGLRGLDRDGVIVTAAADSPGLDFVSRYFVPDAGIDEDPVTGSAHCQLVPFWAERLGKTQLEAAQRSKRGGRLRGELHETHVAVVGRCRLYARARLCL